MIFQLYLSRCLLESLQLLLIQSSLQTYLLYLPVFIQVIDENINNRP